MHIQLKTPLICTSATGVLNILGCRSRSERNVEADRMYNVSSVA